MATQTIEEALRDIIASEGLTRIDVGLTNYSADKPFIALIWYDTPTPRPSKVHGHSAEHGATIDEALEAALADKVIQLGRCAEYVAPFGEAA